jgi:hypothetical protein
MDVASSQRKQMLTSLAVAGGVLLPKCPLCLIPIAAAVGIELPFAAYGALRLGIAGVVVAVASMAALAMRRNRLLLAIFALAAGVTVGARFAPSGEIVSRCGAVVMVATVVKWQWSQRCRCG